MNVFADKMVKSTIRALWMEFVQTDQLGLEAQTENCRIFRAFKFSPSKIKLSLYKKMLDTTRSDIPPLFPYLLLTPWHFDMVTDKKFPFPPLGILHKKEKVTLIKKLRIGEWAFNCELGDFVEMENGIEFKLKSDLLIDGEPHWQSVTTAFKKTQLKKEQKDYPELDFEGAIGVKSFDPIDAFKYGLLSQNIDPIHLSTFSAKMMGHKKNILHGMFMSAYFLEPIITQEVVSIKLKFIKPLYLPNKFFLFEKGGSFYLTNHNKNIPLLRIKFE